MLNWFGRFVLAITALAPIAIAYAWAAYLQSKYLVAFLLALSAPVLVLLCYFLIIFAASRFEKIIVHPKAAEAADRESVALIVLYLILLFTYKFTDLQWNVIIPSMVVLGIIVTSGYNFYFSPMLSVSRLSPTHTLTATAQ